MRDVNFKDARLINVIVSPATIDAMKGPLIWIVGLFGSSLKEE